MLTSTGGRRPGGAGVSSGGPGPFTVVAFNAHPDDEALLSGGTLAGLAREGHRVVLVTATRGERGLSRGSYGDGEALAAARMDELEASAAALGCARVHWLGYADSGLFGEALDPCAFARAKVDEAALTLAGILTSEHADALIVCDRNGGYGHPDHVQVHHVGGRAAAMAGTPVVLEATVPADAFRRALKLAQRLERMGLDMLAALAHPPLGVDRTFSRSRQITHRVSVRQTLTQKRSAMAAHSSQRGADAGERVLERMVRLPNPIFALLFGHEWFIEQGRAGRSTRRESDVLASLRHRGGRASGARGRPALRMRTAVGPHREVGSER